MLSQDHAYQMDGPQVLDSGPTSKRMDWGLWQVRKTYREHVSLYTSTYTLW